MVHEKQIKNEESAALLNQNTRAVESKRPSYQYADCLRARYCNRIPRAAPFGNFSANILTACLFLQNIFTHSTQNIDLSGLSAYKHCEYLHKFPDILRRRASPRSSPDKAVQFKF